MTHDEPNHFESTRIHSMVPDTFDPSQPRVGRRESEPHSTEVSYIHDVLATNFPQHHVLWDLHHYFQLENEELDVQFDISFFLDFSIDYTLSSYRAVEHDNRVPRMVINILSKSTWRADLSDNLDHAKMVKIPVYVVFSPFDMATRPYQPPFARAYLMQPDGEYIQKEVRHAGHPSETRVAQSNQIDMEGQVPFNIGLVVLDKKHEKSKNVYRLVIIDKDTSEILPSKVELQERYAKQETQRAEQEKQRAEQEKQRAEQEKQRAEKYLSILKTRGIDFQE